MNAKDIKKPTQEGTSDLHLLLKELAGRKYHLSKKFMKRRCQDSAPTDKPWRSLLRGGV
jgi:hypothetical protein